MKNEDLDRTLCLNVPLMCDVEKLRMSGEFSEKKRMLLYCKYKPGNPYFLQQMLRVTGPAR